MTTKFTPGPLEFDPEEMVISKDGAQIAVVYGEEEFPCIEDDEREEVQQQAEATGFLFAAAPEIYAVIASAPMLMRPPRSEWESSYQEWLLLAQAALAKAQGGVA